MDGAAGIFLANPDGTDVKLAGGGFDIFRLIVAVVPFKDRDKIGADFGYKKGELKAGEFADFIVLSDDLTKIPPAQYTKIKVVLTVVGGRAVHSAMPH